MIAKKNKEVKIKTRQKIKTNKQKYKTKQKTKIKHSKKHKKKQKQNKNKQITKQKQNNIFSLSNSVYNVIPVVTIYEMSFNVSVSQLFNVNYTEELSNYLNLSKSSLVLVYHMHNPIHILH